MVEGFIRVFPLITQPPPAPVISSNQLANQLAADLDDGSGSGSGDEAEDEVEEVAVDECRLDYHCSDIERCIKHNGVRM